MTIKEAEARTGLARANIRYYEDQGFFTAARGENGYRDYSAEDIDILLKLKLLRQLGFSLEEIHALQSGARSLEEALEQREAGLAQERQELDQAARLCREIRNDGADFDSLDARRYLDGLAREEVVSKDQDPVRIFPWRRYFARELDQLLYTTLLTVLLQLTVHLNIVRAKSGGKFVLDLGWLLLMAAGETLMLHFFGTTPGKALLGLKILREDGSRLSLGEAARRTASVVAFFGGSLLLADTGIPLLAIAGLAVPAWACWQVYHEKPLFWEGDYLYLDGSTRERTFWENGRNYVRIAGYLVSFAACVGLIVGGHHLASMPPHRGAHLTVEQFVENYNQYMAFAYGADNLSRQLTTDGTFEEIEHPGTVVIDVFWDSPVPEAAFQFTQRDGRLTGVALTQQYQSGRPITNEETYFAHLPYDEIYVAMRSFFWRQLGNKEIDRLYKSLVEADGNLSHYLDGVRIDSEMRFSGYDVWGDDTLFAKEGQEQSYFVKFTMDVT